MHHPQGQDQWVKSLQRHAAHASFPDWQPGPDDWAHLHTSFTPDGEPVTEVAVYRDHDRIHYRTYAGGELTRFWERLMGQMS